MRAPSFVVLVAVALLGACGPRSSETDGVADRVLILYSSRDSTVQLAIDEIERRNQRAKGATKAIQVDFQTVSTGAEAGEAARQALPRMEHYRAIYSPSQTFARGAQVVVRDRPIVFDGIDDPVANCLVDSLRRPGRNATGYMHLLQDTEQKMLEVLHDGFPAVRKAIVLVSGHNVFPPCDPSSGVPGEDDGSAAQDCAPGLRNDDAVVEQLVEGHRIMAFGREHGIAVQFLVLCQPKDFASVEEAGRAADDIGFVVPWHSLFDDHRQELIAAVSQSRRPSIYPNELFIQAGGILALEPIRELGRDRVSVLTLMQVLDGRSPATLPVQGPRGFEIVFNAGAAAKQGLQPTLWLLRRADRIVQ